VLEVAPSGGLATIQFFQVVENVEKSRAHKTMSVETNNCCCVLSNTFS